MTTIIVKKKNFTSIIGRGKDRCGAISRRFARSCSASLTILYCSMSSCMIAFCRYLQYRYSTDSVQTQYSSTRHLTPPCISLVLRLLVPLLKSSSSTSAVVRPRLAASSAHPAPDHIT